MLLSTSNAERLFVDISLFIASALPDPPNPLVLTSAVDGVDGIDVGGIDTILTGAVGPDPGAVGLGAAGADAADADATCANTVAFLIAFFK